MTWGVEPGGRFASRRGRHEPLLGGMTPTAGVFFGDIGSNSGQDLGGAIAGGVITYTADGARRVAVATLYDACLAKRRP
jgi:alcohol dehydrogenase (cytochrome c)